jgi:hypothetical protein
MSKSDKFYVFIGKKQIGIVLFRSRFKTITTRARTTPEQLERDKRPSPAQLRACGFPALRCPNPIGKRF